MMACGHAANSTRDGQPACVICTGSPGADAIVETPALVGRAARCGHCASKKPSSPNLPFFKFKGVGSEDALHMCGACHYLIGAHGAWNTFAKRPGITDHEFVAHGAYGYDDFYCGCRGWD